VSFVTQVSERAAFKAFYTVVRGLFHNRWGGDLRSDLTEWTRPADHPTVYRAEGSDFMTFFPAATATASERPLVGGYHDAGDFDQRPTHTVVAQLMLRAFELNRDAFTDRQLLLPESGNGIPDMLDEALWGVAGWEALQDADGGVRMGVESTRHPWAFYLAHEDPLDYFTYSVNAQVTARAAGIFAQAARLVEPYDATRSASLRERALRAYGHATSHGAKAAYRLYAAGELLRLTGESRYASDFERAWAEMGSSGAFAAFADHQYSMGDYRADMGGGTARAMADFLQGYLGSSIASESIRTAADGRLRTFADQKLEVQNNAHAHRSPRPPSYSLTWGQGTTIARYLDTVIAALQRGGLSEADRQRYFDALSLAADYVLGANPEGLVFMTGLGSRRVEEPLHLDSLVWAQRGIGPVPGIPVFGLTDAIWQPWSAPAENAFYPQPFENQPRGRRYADVRTVIVTNEFTVWETQAPLAELFGVLVGTGMVPPESWLPGRPDHRNTLP
jgi:endoglucanase